MTRRAEHVLVLTLVFPPESVSTAQLYGELVQDLISQGRCVTVITTKPHYHPEAAERQRAALTPAWGGLMARSQYHGADVFHTAMPLKGEGIPARIAGWLGFHGLSLAVASSVSRVDVVLAPSPPLTMGIVARLVARLKRVPYIYNVQELYPDTAVALGTLREGSMLRTLRRMERAVYDGAFAVVAIASGMRDRIVSKGIDGDRVRVIPNFVDTADITPRLRDNPFAREFALRDRFVVMYAGNIGRAQGLDVLLDAAVLTRDRTDIIYVFVGEGVVRESLRRRAEELSLENVLFVPQQPYARVPDIYGASDVNVVSLTASLVGDAVPSKVYRVMAAERPVLAIADRESDLSRIVIEAGAGWVVAPHDARGIAEAVRGAAARRETLGELGASGRAYVMDHVTRARVTALWGSLLDEAVIRWSDRRA